MKKYVELRLRRDFGGVVTAYLDFIKGNIKGMFNTFINYNAILIILIFVASFLVSSGFASIARAQSTLIANGDTGEFFDSAVLYMIGFLLYLVIYFVMFIVNSGLSGGFIKLYEERKELNPDRRDVLQILKNRAGGLILISLIALPIFAITFVISFIVLLIPIIGALVLFPAIMITYITWIGMAMFAYTYHENYSVGQALGAGWDLMFSNFWKAIGAVFIVSVLVYVISIAMQLIPTAINFYITFNSIEESGGIQDGIAFQVFIFFFYSLSSILAMFAFYLIQTAIGVVYIDLNEHRHNTYLRTRIERLGQPS